MRHFAANYIFDGENLIKNSFISVDENNKIIYVGKENEGLTERPLMIFFNGILTPGFVNTHCHLELSDYKKSDDPKKGLTNFIQSIIHNRNNGEDEKKIYAADAIMYERGINLIGDIVNTNKTLKIKQNSRIEYHNFVEISGIKESDSAKRIVSSEVLANEFDSVGLKNSIVPHSYYSISPTMLEYLGKTSVNKIISLHFMESGEESEFYKGEKNALYKFLTEITPSFSRLADNCSGYYKLLQKFEDSASLILVHNVMTDSEMLPEGPNYYFCLCPASNIFLGNNLPSHDFVYRNSQKLTIGTDSLASNTKLDIMHELKLLSQNYDKLDLISLLKISTINGAKALQNNNYGRFKEGMSPGVVLIENIDLVNLKLKETSFAKRII